MKKIFNFLLKFNLLVVTYNIWAEVPMTLIEPESIKENPANQWSNSSYVGYAWSMKAGIKNPDENKFIRVAPGGSDDIMPSNTSYAGISLGRKIGKHVVLSISYDIFNGLGFQNYYTGGSLPGHNNQDTNFLRSFALAHQSILLNLALNLPDKWQCSVSDLNIKPVVGAGLGVGVNQVSNFQVIIFSDLPSSVQISTIGLTNIKSSLAWYVNVGVGFQPKGTAAYFGVAYRYYNGGAFSSGSKFVVTDSNEGSLVDVAPWTGTLKTNQIKLFLEFDF